MLTTRLSRALRLMVVLTTLIIAASCDGTEVAVVQQDSQVKRDLAVVWAGAGTDNPLPRLEDANWHNLPAGGMVTTDAAGQARLSIGGCLTIYVYQNSGLTKAACTKAGQAAGNVTCSISGTSAYNN